MPFQKGRTKTGGRVKGVTNKVSLEIKSRIEEIAPNVINRIETELKALSGTDFLHYAFKFIEYVVPKQKETKIDFSSLSEDEAGAIIDEIIERLKAEKETT